MSRKNKNKLLKNSTKKKDFSYKLSFDKMVYLLLTTVTLILYWNILRGGFLYNVIPVIDKTASLGLSNLFISFISLDPIFTSPVQSLLFTFDYILFGSSPFVFHMTNIVLHVIASCLLYGFFKNFTTKEISFLAAVLFSVHPALTETVGAIIGRGEIAGLIFFLLSFKYFLKNSKKSFKLSLLFFYLSILSSKVFFFFPFAFILYEYSYKEKIDFKRNALYFLLPFVYLIHGKLANFGFLHGNYFIPKEGLLAIILTNVKVFSFYIFKFFAPFDLSYSYSFTPQLSVTGFMSLLNIQLFVVTVFIFFLCFIYYKKFAFVFSFPLLAILPLMTIFPQIKFVSLTNMYVVSFAFIFVFIFFLEWLVKKYSLNVCVFLVVPLFIILFSFSFQRNIILSDNLKLLKDTIFKSYDNPQLNYNLAFAFEENGNYERALFFYEKALKLDMNYSMAYYKVATLYAILDNKDFALKALKWAFATGDIDKEKALKDPAFVKLKRDPDFVTVIEGARKGADNH